MTPEEYADLLTKTYQLIIIEIESAKKLSETDRQALYPKLVIMCEFYAFLRGDAFIDVRPFPTPEGKQKEYYKNEDYIRFRLAEIKHTTEIESERTKNHLDQLIGHHFQVDEKKRAMAEYNKKLAEKPRYPSNGEEFLEFYYKAVEEGKPFMLHGFVDDPDVSSLHGTQAVRILKLYSGEFRLAYSPIIRSDFKRAPFMANEADFVAAMKKFGVPEEMIDEVVASSKPGYERDMSDE